jgi:cytochrome c biogenesis protein CcmG, thiol:disulfide interchange protein DsbE
MSSGAHQASAAGSVPKKAPEFVRADLENRQVDLAHYRGKVVLLNFWATWCAPCEAEMPTFVRWQTEYASRGLQVIGISMDDDPLLARGAYGKLKLNYPVAMGDAALGDLYGGVLGLPVTYLIDARGEIRAKFQGEADLQEMERQLVLLLKRH